MPPPLLVKLQQQQNHQAIDVPDGKMYDDDCDTRRERHEKLRFDCAIRDDGGGGGKRLRQETPDHSPHLLKQGAGREEGRAGSSGYKRESQESFHSRCRGEGGAGVHRK